MMLRRTAAGVPGQAEFTLSYVSEMGVDLSLDWFVQWLETRIRNGEHFKVGESLRVGWLTCFIAARPDGTLAIHEPDFQTIPMTLTEAVSRTLGQLWYQRQVADSVGLVEKLDFPSCDQLAMMCTAFAGADTVVLHRFTHEADESGWFVGCNNAGHDHHDPAEIDYVSLYDLAVRNPAIVGFLALPADCTVIVGDEAPLIARGDDVLSFRDGSLLASVF